MARRRFGSVGSGASARPIVLDVLMPKKDGLEYLVSSALAEIARRS